MSAFWTSIYVLATVVFIVWVIRGLRPRPSPGEDRPDAGESNGRARRHGDSGKKGGT